MNPTKTTELTAGRLARTIGTQALEYMYLFP